MEFINFRSENDTLIMTLNEEADFKILINSIYERLQILKQKPSAHPPYVNLVLGKRKVKPSELLELIDLFIKEGIMLINSIHLVKTDEQKIEVIESSIRAGQLLKFNNSVMVIGDVHPGATVIARNNIYIVGRLMGNATVKSKNGKIVSAVYQNAIVKIFDSEPTIISSNNGELLTYENGTIKKNLVEEYKAKRSETNGADNYDYVR